ncbi:hypothetical protein LPW11_20400 [Geomonas sp. RF6]|uniref:hypothetical protein n=1 Tax=Geomonas sp. RF6 TaxID=2897342 RepID=UPI001E489EAF|nr:hypothetical protein [Geomonas sp. RF6]UFS70222.1 hypothetical protein LPW11_20400 [Geomonas sp. RF6]
MKKSKLIEKVLLVLAVGAIAGCGGGSGSSVGGNGGPGGGGATSVQMGGAVQGTALALTGSIGSFAGSTASSDGVGAAARFNHPNSVTSDGTFLYVADTANNLVRKVAIANGAVSTLAGAAGVTGSSDGTGSAARFNTPYGITISADKSTLYVCDTGNDTIRSIAIASGAVSTVAGSAGQIGSANGVGAAARFNAPTGITTDGPSLFVADTFNNAVRRIDIASGTVSTLAGSGSPGFADGVGTEASFTSPLGITTDGATVYLTDNGNSAVRSISLSSGSVSTLVESNPLVASPAGIATDGTTLYVADADLNVVQKVDIATQAVSTLAGDAVTGAAGAVDGTGGAARFNQPAGLVLQGTNLFLADAENGTIRAIAVGSAAVSTVAGTPAGADGTGAASSFNSPYDLATDGSSIYVADAGSGSIRKIAIATGAVSTVAGSAGSVGSADGTAGAARFNFPSSITTTLTDLYVADSGNHTIRKISLASGAVTTFAGSAGSAGNADGSGGAARFFNPGGITTDMTYLYVSDTDNNAIRKVNIATGAVTTLVGATAGLSSPYGITTDGTSLYVADAGNNAIKVVSIATGAVSTLSITGGALNYPTAVTTDGTSLYVADSGNGAVRRIVLASGAMTTISSAFHNPSGITTDGTRLYVADASDNVLLKLW